jgi:hypothetical protein
MGVGLCERCIKKYYQRMKWENGLIMGSWRCAKCGHWPSKGFYGLDLEWFEARYRYRVGWLPAHRAKMSRKRKGIKRRKGGT